MFYLFLFFFQIFKSCSIGCLRCDAIQKCQVCDINNGYFLRDKTCTKIQVPNCKIFSLEGQCLQCEDHYRFSKDKQKCILADFLPKCIKYDQENQCIACSNDYYVNNGICRIVEVFIQNCAVYLDRNRCQICDENFLLSFDKKFCMFQGETENCKYWSQIRCNKCQEGYVNSINFQRNDFQTNAQDYFLDYFDQGVQMKYFNVCQKINVQNCEILQSFEKCAKCKQGFYQTQDYNCVQYPLPQIYHCIEYQDAETCLDCLQGFYLYKNQCIKVASIENCSLYNTQSISSECIECVSDFYLQNNTCIERKNSIDQKVPNCIKKDIYSDFCAVCSESYYLSFNKLKCIQKIQNCQEHSQQNTNDQLVCMSCIDGFYLEQGSCVIGNIPNCLQYQGQDKCIKCENKYYLTKNQLCSMSNQINQCEIYDGQTQYKPNSCLKCDQNSFNFDIQLYCKQVQQILNCLLYDQYDQKGKCIKCDNGYFLNYENKCDVIQNSRCSSGDSSQNCDQCFSNYVLHQDGQYNTCVSPYRFDTENCYQSNIQKINSITLNDVQCFSCSKYYLLFNLKNTFVCLQKQNLYTKNISLDQQIQNCQRYKPDIGCIQCTQGYFLQPKNQFKECVRQCNIDYSLQMISLVQQEKKYKVYLNDQCVLKNQNCEIYAPKTHGLYQNQIYNESYQDLDNMYICIKCKQDRIEVVDKIIKNFTNMNYNPTDRDKYVIDYQDFYPEVKCYYPVLINQKPIEQYDQNCLYIQELNDSQNLGCNVCKTGYSGFIKIMDQYTYVDKCEIDTHCQEVQLYKGLHNYYQNYVSCFQCLQKERLVVTWVETEIIGNQLYIKQLSKSNENKKNFQCLLESEIYQTDKQIIPNFCQYVFINTSQQIENFQDNQTANLNFDESNPPKLSIFCGGCTPSFRPTFINENNQHVVTKCTKIQNCDTDISQNIINKCQKCKNGYVFLYEENSYVQIKQDQCIKNDDQNCFAASQSDLGTVQCKLCQKGYFLNKDFICEKIVTPLCSNSSSSIFQQGYQVGILMDYYYYAFTQGNGCYQCMDDFVQLEILDNKNLCVYSNYLQENLDSNKAIQNSSNFFIDKCEIYSKIDEQYICQKCEFNQLLTIDQKNCVDMIPNCQIADPNKYQCAQCEESYALIQKNCKKGNIENCQNYFVSENKNTILCKTCNESFYKTVNQKQCLKGLVQNCQIYQQSSDKKCKKCFSGYMLIDRTIDICYPINPQLNCVDSKFNKGIVCSKCIQNNYVFVQQYQENTEFSQQTICMNFNKIQFCEIYDMQESFENSTFQCLKCKQNYFLENYQCNLRQKIHPSCQIYEKNKDLCKKCVTGSYLNENRDGCILYPSGMMGCIEYSEQSICILCKQDYFLKENQCQRLNDQDYIENCINYVYKDQKVMCEKCIQQFYLQDQQCIQAKAQNCLKYKDENNCSSCISGYELKIDDVNVLNCQKIVLPDCQQINLQIPSECQLCNEGYYLDPKKICKKVDTKLEGCIQYETSDKCQICSQDYILKKSSQICLSKKEIEIKIDQNCAENIFELRPVCQGCKSGYIFVNNRCVSCDDTNGCAYCSTQNTSLCYMCKSGYFQNQNGKCIKVIEQVTNRIGIVYVKLFLLILIKF